jgi:hypothetical protein
MIGKENNMMFDFRSYEDRKVARYDGPEGYVSTAKVTDSDDPYETGIMYHKWGERVVIVQTYTTKDEAKVAHRKWVRAMKQDKLPKEKPRDVGTNAINKLLRLIEGKETPAP